MYINGNFHVSSGKSLQQKFTDLDIIWWKCIYIHVSWGPTPQTAKAEDRVSELPGSGSPARSPPQPQAAPSCFQLPLPDPLSALKKIVFSSSIVDL